MTFLTPYIWAALILGVILILVYLFPPTDTGCY